MSTQTPIGDIGNYYGGLLIKADGDKYFWGIEDYDGVDWSEIPEKLYVTLISYEMLRLEHETNGKA